MNANRDMEETGFLPDDDDNDNDNDNDASWSLINSLPVPQFHENPLLEQDNMA